ncbi:MAG: hypothetical protein DMF89_21885 [Acidobacteria bacterium]|nr:MAG: hypothetical protein DMF90_08670 [Acidobacteriota bacterium]PYR46469.1 MAG: hypothetical protein DMF89_21885 [Acidobacteriota bacterium]
MRRVPRQHLHADFVRAVRASGHSPVTLAALANVASFTRLSPLLSRRIVRASTLNAERLRKLAVVVNYDGPIFKEATR